MPHTGSIAIIGLLGSWDWITYVGAIAGPLGISFTVAAIDRRYGKLGREFLLCAFALQFVFNDVSDFGVRLIPAQKTTIDEQRRSAGDSVFSAFLDIRLYC